MGEPQAEEAMRRGGGGGAYKPKNTDAVLRSHLSGSDENQNKLTGKREDVDWGAAQQDSANNSPRGRTSDNSRSKSYAQTSNTEGSRELSKARGASGGHPEVCPPGPSPSLLASLQSLGQHSDHTLLPQSLHQIAEAYFLEEDYPWAVQFLNLEKLYHERLLSNLASLQKEWEAQWKVGALPQSCSSVETDCTDSESKHMDSLSHICRTHQRPTLCVEQNTEDTFLKDSLRPGGAAEDGNTERGTPAGKWENRVTDNSSQQAEKEEDGNGEEEEEEDGEELLEDECFEEELEEDTGGATMRGRQATVDDLGKCIQVEEISPANGLVSILKRRASLEGTASSKPAPPKQAAKRKVRFTEPDDGLDQDDVGGDSCLILLLLCLVTVVISLGGTALYCLVGGTSSSVCADFSHNVDFYIGHVRRGVDTLTRWLSPGPS